MKNLLTFLSILFITPITYAEIESTDDVYYESLADSSIPKNLMISKIFSHEIMGQSTSNRLYKDVEKSVQKLISMLIDQWYKDNPMKQF